MPAVVGERDRDPTLTASSQVGRETAPVGARILIVEDDVKQAELIRMYLEREGHSPAVVHDGRAALEHARRKRPDLVVLDVMLPRVDGLDVCRILRHESSVPIVM